MAKLIAACLALAASSLLLPSEPSYDPWAWLVWARELTHLGLDTTAGPSWKPLTVALLVPVAPLAELDSSLPPALWTIIARAGALLALALAFRLARRLAGAGPSGILAGAVAAGALALTPDWFQFAAHASEAPLAVALMLWAIERHLDGRREHALVLGALACLLRPELFPFLCAYALWLWRAESTRRSLIAGLMLVVPLAWTVPEWIGSGNPLGGGEQARSEPRWSLSHAEQPWRRALMRVDNHAGTALELLALVAVAFAVARRQSAIAVLALAAVAEAGLYLLMTEADFSGNPRYVLPALVLLCVLAGVGAARLTAAASAFGPMSLRVAGGLAAVGALALLATPHVERGAERLAFEAREVSERMSMHRDLDSAVAAVGGPEAVTVHGPAAANRALRTHLAWTLGATISEIEGARGQGLVFKTENRFLAGRLPVWGRPRERRLLAAAGRVQVVERRGVPEYVFIRGVAWAFTHRLQGIHIPARGGRIGAIRVVTR